jgi:glycerol-3-phosphate acyltransferase PlsY
LDIAKGFVPVWLALNVKQDVILLYVVPLTAALAVAGHCWPVFAQFRGGMGLATAGGALLAIHPLAFLLSLGILILLTLTIRHSARASVFTGLLIAPLLWLFNLRGIAIWAAVAIGLVIAFRFLIDWNRKYRELWLDREKSKDA